MQIIREKSADMPGDPENFKNQSRGAQRPKHMGTKPGHPGGLQWLVLEGRKSDDRKLHKFTTPLEAWSPSFEPPDPPSPSLRLPLDVVLDPVFQHAAS